MLGKRIREDQEAEDTRELEEEKQELHRAGQPISWVHVKSPWIDPETGEILDNEFVEKALELARASYRKFKVKRDVPGDSYERAVAAGKERCW